MIAALEGAGTLGFLAVPRLLGDLSLRRSTGRLALWSGAAEKRVFLKNGVVVFASSNLECDRLGDVLLARGVITREQLEESSRQMAATGRRQGLVLVQIGALAPQELFRGLLAQVREIVLSVFSWDSGGYRFLEGIGVQEEIVNLRLPVSALLFEGLSRIQGDRRFRSAWDPRTLRHRLAPTPPIAPEQLDCPPEALRLLELIGRGRPWEEIERSLGAGAASLLCALALLGVVESVRAAPPAVTSRPPSPPSQPATAAETAPPRVDAAALRGRVEQLAGRLSSLNLYQVLGLTPQADSSAIRQAYLSLAKEFHPDRFFRPGLTDLQGRVNEIFMKVNEAHGTLSRPASRSAYDRELLRPASAPPASGEEEHPRRDSRIAAEQFSKGLSLLEGGDLWSAIQAFRWAVSLSPKNPRYRAALGAALLRSKKRLHEAEEHCKAAIELEPGNPDHRVRLGQVYRTGRLPEKAREQFEAALRIDPRNREAMRELGELTGRPVDKRLLERLFRS